MKRGWMATRGTEGTKGRRRFTGIGGSRSD